MPSAPAAVALAQSHLTAGRPDAAAAALRDVLRADPAHPPALHRLAVLDYQAGGAAGRSHGVTTAPARLAHDPRGATTKALSQRVGARSEATCTLFLAPRRFFQPGLEPTFPP